MHNCGVADTDPVWHCLSHSGKTQYSTVAQLLRCGRGKTKYYWLLTFLYMLSRYVLVLDTSCNMGNKQRASINVNKIKDRSLYLRSLRFMNPFATHCFSTNPILPGVPHRIIPYFHFYPTVLVRSLGTTNCTAFQWSWYIHWKTINNSPHTITFSFLFLYQGGLRGE